MSRLPLALFCSLFLIAVALTAQDSLNAQRPPMGIDISGQWFVAYQNVEEEGQHSNQFFLRRGYVTFGKKFNDLISVRFTQDIITDREGSDAGNIEMRLKYLYIRLKTKGMPGLGQAYLDFGMVSRPWLDFEEKINRYRLQGTMYAERVGIMNSADFGLTFVTLLGGKLDESYVKSVNDAFPGKYGSVSLGVYNGGGYYALEKNNGKTLEGRLSLRPLPVQLPGLQLTYSLALGEGNIPEGPDWRLHLASLSYAVPAFRSMIQYVDGTGNSFGSLVDENMLPRPLRGYSLFGEYTFARHFSLIGRYDLFSARSGDTWEDGRRTIAGFCYHFLHGQKVLINADVYDPEGHRETVVELVAEIRF
ncbi:MAG TPA: hypothetical protein P5550_09935 [Bacteroidales bacterium]|nr:hypothetical protein [Bacteroidales bacterium]HRZ76149.1 hypothetical protein [Bacteroidales bacterium]